MITDVRKIDYRTWKNIERDYLDGVDYPIITRRYNVSKEVVLYIAYQLRKN